MAKKTGNTKPLAKEDEGRSCGMDTFDLLVINQKFSDLYEKSGKKAFKYLQQQSKEFGFDPEELQQSLLEGGKRDETDIERSRHPKFGSLYGTVGDDEIIINDRTIDDDLSQLEAYGYFGDDIITNNKYWHRTYTSAGAVDDVYDFNVNAWGGSGKDHFSARWTSRLIINDLEEGEKITITNIPKEDLEVIDDLDEGVYVEVFVRNRSNPNDDGAAIGRAGGYGTAIFIPNMPPNVVIEPLSQTIDNVNDVFSRTFEIRPM